MLSHICATPHSITPPHRTATSKSRLTRSLRNEPKGQASFLILPPTEVGFLPLISVCPSVEGNHWEPRRRFQVVLYFDQSIHYLISSTNTVPTRGSLSRMKARTPAHEPFIVIKRCATMVPGSGMLLSLSTSFLVSWRRTCRFILNPACC